MAELGEAHRWSSGNRVMADPGPRRGICGVSLMSCSVLMPPSALLPRKKPGPIARVPGAHCTQLQPSHLPGPSPRPLKPDGPRAQGLELSKALQKCNERRTPRQTCSGMSNKSSTALMAQYSACNRVLMVGSQFLGLFFLALQNLLDAWWY